MLALYHVLEARIYGIQVKWMVTKDGQQFNINPSAELNITYSFM